MVRFELLFDPSWQELTVSATGVCVCFLWVGSGAGNGSCKSESLLHTTHSLLLDFVRPIL